MKNFQLLVVSFFGVIAVSNCFAQKEHSVKQIADSIAINNYVAPVPDGFWFGETDQYRLFLELTEKASIEELIAYTDDSRPIVRVYAIKILNDRKYNKTFELAVKHIHDTATVSESGIHRSVQRKVGDYFMATTNFSEKEHQQLDSILFFTDNALSYTTYLLDDLPIEEIYYARMKHLAETNDFAVVALAKYQKEEDIDFIASRIAENSYFTLDAIENFPTERFKRTLLSLREQGFHYYGTELAVAAFKDEFSVDFFNHLLSDPTRSKYAQKEDARYIFEAIQKYHDPIFNDLYFRLWEQFNKIDKTTFDYLKTVNPVCALELTKATLGKPDEYGFNSLLLAPLLDFLAEHDSMAVKELIIFHINRGHYDNLAPFTEKANTYNDPEITNALFNQLKKAKNAYVYLPIVECVLRYNDAGLNEQLLNAIRENTEIKDWGLEKVDQRLTEYGLKR